MLLLWNPDLPADPAGGPGAARPWVLVDGSTSMGAQDGSGVTLWTRAGERAAELTGPDDHVATFGESALGPHPDSLPGPVFGESRLAPALDRALEAGASRVTVISDLRLSDPSSVAARVERFPVPIAFESPGTADGPNAGVGRLELLGGAEPGDSILVEVGVVSGATGTPVDLELMLDGTVVAGETVVPASAGREATVRFALPPADTAGFLRIGARTRIIGDAFAADDMRERLLQVDPGSGGLVLLSFAADWEPRFLLPVLERVTGLRPMGYLALQGDRWLRLGSGGDGGGIASTDDVRRRAAGAELLVLHGTGPGAADWVAEAAGRAGRLIVFPDGPEGLYGSDLRAGTPREGEWYAATEPPPSSLAGSLAGVAWAGLPPLTDVMPLEDGAGRDVPLALQLRGSGAPEAALVLTTEGTRRRATVLARGFWRWGFRPGQAGEAYRRLWAGVGGWLLANEPLSGGPQVGPVARGDGTRGPWDWSAAGRAGEDLTVSVEPWAEIPADGSGASQAPVSVDTTVTVERSGAFRTPALPVGDYRYAVRDREGQEVGSGRHLVSGWSGDRERPAMEPPAREGSGAGAGPGPMAGGGRPVRTHPLPYLLALTLLSAEWILRRRRGLR